MKNRGEGLAGATGVATGDLLVWDFGEFSPLLVYLAAPVEFPVYPESASSLLLLTLAGTVTCDSKFYLIDYRCEFGSLIVSPALMMKSCD